MIISHNWLRVFVPHDKTAVEIGTLLNDHTVTLDGMEPLRKDLASIVVGYVVECAKHPDSDHLSITKVDDGSGTLLDVVCGAPNVMAGVKYPFARGGTTMPDGLKIEKRKIRGQTSNGMLCSARELKLGVEHDGILPLTTDAAPGTPILDVLTDSGDVQLNLDVLPNRPDLLSHMGIAREVAALTGVHAQLPPELTNPSPVERTAGLSEATADGVTVRVDDLVKCPRYIAIIIRDVRVEASPDWLRERLESAGSRSINNVVDATNYALLGLGQPMHAFDLSKLRNSGIVVRSVDESATLTTLDGVSRPVAAGTTVICDGVGPTAFAGVMGGRESEVTRETRHVLLEAAVFDPRFVRRVRRSLGLSTDASYRYERGVDAASLEEYARIIASLIRAIAGGRVTALIDIGAPTAPRAAVRVRPSRVARLLGDPVPTPEIDRVLRSIACDVVHAGGDELHVTPPSWRHDLTIEADVIEEVVRLRGFDLISDELRPFRPGTVPDHPLHLTELRLRALLVGRGVYETRPMPFTSNSASGIRVQNPLSDDEPYLRTTIIETLARRAEYNLNRMEGDVRLFEVGHVFLPSPDSLPREEVRVGALLMGRRRPAHFTEPEPEAFDAWDAKALAEGLAAAAFPGTAIALAPAAEPWLWRVTSDGVDIGGVQRVALDAPVWASHAFGIELTLGVMPSADVAPHGSHAPAGESDRAIAAPHVVYAPIPVMPAAGFDVALVLPGTVSAAEVDALIRRESGDLLESLVVFDEYRGDKLPDGVRSVGWRLQFRHPERTLRDKELDGRRSRLVSALQRELGVTVRG
jgi:phenylalanyl-tRNA synthetase beta chain